MKKKLMILTAVLVAGIGSYALFAGNGDKPTYLTEPVVRSRLAQTVIASGSIESVNEVDVGAQVSGKIIKLYVQLGQDVKKGDRIADIDSTTQLNALNSQKAQLASYQAQLAARQTALKVAESSFERLNRLYRQNATSLDERNNAQNTLETARAEVAALQESIKQAEIEVNTAETNVGYTRITSPIDGTVISTPISEGQTVNSNQTTPTIVKVADLSQMRIKPEISEGDITKVKAGQAVSFTILSDNRTEYQAVIDSVDPATTTISDNTSTTSSSSSTTNAVYYYANVIVPNPDRVLRIGMTTENKIKIVEVPDALVISTMALQKQGDKFFVDVLKNGDQVERREVETGVQNDFQTEIKSGLAEGEQVIVSQVAAGEKTGNSQFRGPRF